MFICVFLLLVIQEAVSQDADSDGRDIVSSSNEAEEDILIIDEEEMVVAEIHAFRPVFKYRGLRARKT